ncbi:hypothetical protein BU14_0382s0002 [Porphyra umbilicalis]|uniref:Uncharacterized protein n=1 Tax=Porphyra umbilicalis TaxID=2786 RepID=A0A1X6NWP9_PORUM|nr:hypothetical protein BU14_0382s0002 [Porphyra umbilicalis]|eukprot:OSX73041.1 hypothetical protein BU14_0382s0002 [Porphyra umbilicalis]
MLARCRGEIPCKDSGRTSNSKKGQPQRGTNTHTEENKRTNRGQQAHEQSQNGARRESVAFVSINQIAEPATLHSDQPFLIADPPDHTPLPPSRPPPPLREHTD